MFLNKTCFEKGKGAADEVISTSRVDKKHENSNQTSIFIHRLFDRKIILCLLGLAFLPATVLAGPCEEVAFSNSKDFAQAMTRGLSLNKRQSALFKFYMQNFYPYPYFRRGRSLKDVFHILKKYPELTKPALREMILEFPIRERKRPESLNNFIRSVTRSAGKIRNSLFQIESNLGFWIKMLDFSSTDTSFQPSSEKPRRINQQASPVLSQDQGSNKANRSKEAIRLKKQQQKEDFIAYLNNTALNEETRAFIQDTSIPYRERTIALYKALEELRNVYRNSKAVVQRIEQAMVDLVRTTGFGNVEHTRNLKSSDPTQSYEALRKIFKEPDILALELGFEGRFAEMQASLKTTGHLNTKLAEDIHRLKQIETDIKTQPWTTTGKERLRLRALSLQESPFRSCLSSDCATQMDFAKALDPNFLYFTLTDKNHRSGGFIAVVLGSAENQNSQRVKVAFVDKIQEVRIDRVRAMLEGIRRVLKEEGYLLGLPKELGNYNGLTNSDSIRSYMKEKILSHLTIRLKTFRPHEHDLSFESVYSRANIELPLWEFDSASFKDIEGRNPESHVPDLDLGSNKVRIKAGDIHPYRTASSSVSIRSLYKPILSLKNSKKEEDQITFLNNLVIMSEIPELRLSAKYVRQHLTGVLKEKRFSLRKKAFFTLIEFEVWKDKVSSWSILAQSIDSFSRKELTEIIGEVSNWKNTIGYKRAFVNTLDSYIHFSPIKFFILWNGIGESAVRLHTFKSILESPWRLILDKESILVNTITNNLINRAEKTKAIQVLLSIGADPNATDIIGQTALQTAARSGQTPIVKLLLESGANLDIQSRYGNTALMQVVWSRGWQLEGDIQSATPMAIWHSGIRQAVDLLLKNGADPNIQNKSGETALMVVVSQGKLPIVDLLLKNGANPDIQNKDGNTALMMAVSQGKLPIVDLLLKNGANPDIQNKDGNTALMYVRGFGQTENQIIELLLEHGANPGIQNKDGDIFLINPDQRAQKQWERWIQHIPKKSTILSLLNESP